MQTNPATTTATADTPARRADQEVNYTTPAGDRVRVARYGRRVVFTIGIAPSFHHEDGWTEANDEAAQRRYLDLVLGIDASGEVGVDPDDIEYTERGWAGDVVHVAVVRLGRDVTVTVTDEANGAQVSGRRRYQTPPAAARAFGQRTAWLRTQPHLSGNRRSAAVVLANTLSHLYV